MKNSEINMSFLNMQGIISQGGKKDKTKYPIKFSFALTRNLKLLEPLQKDFEEEKAKLLDLYNVKDENGDPAYKKTNQIEIAEEHKEKWEKELQELLDIDVEFAPHMIPVEDFPNEIEPDIVYVLDFMIKE